MPKRAHKSSQHVLDLKRVPKKESSSDEVIQDSWISELGSTKKPTSETFLRPHKGKLRKPRDKQPAQVIKWSKAPKRKRKGQKQNLLSLPSNSKSTDFGSVQEKFPFFSLTKAIKKAFSRKKEYVDYEESRYRVTGFSIARQMTWLLIGALVMVLPVQAYNYYQGLTENKDNIEQYAISGLQQLESAGLELADFNFTGASEDFLEARREFTSAQAEFDAISIWAKAAAHFTPGASAAQKLLEIGRLAAEGGHFLTQGLNLALNTPPQSYLETGEETTSLTNQLEIVANGIELAKIRFDKMQTLLEEIDTKELPKEYQSKFIELKEKIPYINQSLEHIIEIAQHILSILGHDTPKRYLLVFQNNAELRPSGGFMGSLAVVDVSGGKISRLEVPGGGPYDFKGSQTATVASPEALWLVQPVWQFQDANWWPDWPSSAQKIMWFYERAGGSTVDGVWAMTPDIIEDLLKLVGPIELEEYGITLTSENFREKTQKQVEIDYDRTENKPKKIIADLTPLLLDKVFHLPQERWLEVLGVIEQNLRQKSFLFNFTDPALQNFIRDFGWTGEVKTAPRDYLMAVEANISGGKTDLVIMREIEHTVRINPDGTTRDTVKITRTHSGNPSDIFEGNTNNAYIRVYVPAGSRLLSAKGFTTPGAEHFKEPPDSVSFDEDLKRIRGPVYVHEEFGVVTANEFGKTTFGGWQSLHPGESKTITLTYEIPWKLVSEPKDIVEKGLDALGLLEHTAVYSLLVQKQPGITNQRLTSNIVWPEEWETVWHTPKETHFSESENIINWRTDLSVDRVFGAVFEK